MNQEYESKLNKRDSALNKMRETNRSLTNLAQSKHLDTRENLQSELESLKAQLSDRDEENMASHY